jgi:Tfp pilus assembly protein PilN
VAAAEVRDARLDRLALYVGGVVVTAAIALGGWAGGRLYEALDAQRERTYALEKENIELRAEVKALQKDLVDEIVGVKDQTRRQWERHNETNTRISQLEGRVDRYHNVGIPFAPDLGGAEPR